MKNGWEVKTLAAVSAINYGFTERASSEPVGPRFLRITDIQEDRVDWQSVPYCKIESVNIPKYRLASGDIVFARTGATTGKSFLVDNPPDAVFASYLIRLRLLDKKLLPEFVSLFFQTDDYWQSIKDGSAGSAQGGFNATKLGALTIPVPTIREQQRIIGILEEAFASIATAKVTAEKNLQNAIALFESHLQFVFARRGKGWVTRPLADCLELITYGFTNPMPTTTEGPYMITAKNVVGGRIDYKASRRTSREIFNTLLTDKSRPRVGDVLLTKDGTLGRIAVVDQPDICINQSVALLRPNARMEAQFMRCLLSSPDYQKRMVDDAGGTTIKHIYITRVNKMPVTFPESLEEQQRVIVSLDALHEGTQRLAGIYGRKLTALEALKKSLLNQAFSGTL